MALLLRSHQIGAESRFVEAGKKGVQTFLDLQKQMKDSGVAQDKIKEQLGVPGVHCANGLLM
eukprot:9041741-Karenia_brevis.AAC.1